MFKKSWHARRDEFRPVLSTVPGWRSSHLVPRLIAAPSFAWRHTIRADIGVPVIAELNSPVRGIRIL